MQNIPTKVDGSTTLPASEFNQIPDELENAITDTGQTLSSGTLNQLSKAIAIYAAGGDFYTDSGAADAYVLDLIGSKQAPIAYFVGMRVRFLPSGTNTGASTVNVNSLGSINIKQSDGTTDVTAGQIIADNEIILTYDGTNFRLPTPSQFALVDDTSPQLGGDLDLNGNQVTSPDGTDLIDIPDGSIDLQTDSTSRVDITDSGVRLGGANSRVTTILDEDTMSSDSATALATQQSIKAYVDNNSGGGGSWVELDTQTASSSTNINFDNTLITSTYTTYVIIYSSIDSASDNVTLDVQFSTDNGSTFETCNGHIAILKNTSASYSGTTVTAGSQVYAATSIGNAAGEGVGGIIYISGAASTATNTFTHGTYSGEAFDGSNVGGGFIGSTTTSTAINYVRVKLGGVMTAGRLTLYGIAHS